MLPDVERVSISDAEDRIPDVRMPGAVRCLTLYDTSRLKINRGDEEEDT